MSEYNTLYDEFLKFVDGGSADAVKAAGYLVKMSRIFSEYNTAAVEAKKKAVTKLAEISKTVDPATNKPITGTKAEALTEASPEGFSVMEFKAHLENIQVYLSAIKYLQMSLGNEFDNSRNV